MLARPLIKKDLKGLQVEGAGFVGFFWFATKGSMSGMNGLENDKKGQVRRNTSIKPIGSGGGVTRKKT